MKILFSGKINKAYLKHKYLELKLFRKTCSIHLDLESVMISMIKRSRLIVIRGFKISLDLRTYGNSNQLLQEN